MFVGKVLAAVFSSARRGRLHYGRYTVARCTKWHPNGGLGNPARIVWGRRGNLGRTSLRVQSQIGDKPGLGSCVVNGRGRHPRQCFRLKVAEMHDVHMVLSGGSMCEEVYPCRVIQSVRIAASSVMDYLETLRGT